MKHNAAIDPTGTFSLGYFRASYAELEKLLGKPAIDESDKISTEWRVEFEGQIFTIYDYKMTNRYDPNLPDAETLRKCPALILWHIGSNKHDKFNVFCRRLSSLLFEQEITGERPNV